MFLAHFQQPAVKKYAQSATKFRAKQRANQIHPLRDGSEKTKAFLVERGQSTLERYKRSQLGASGLNTQKKALGFFGHVTEQASGWLEGEAVDPQKSQAAATRRALTRSTRRPSSAITSNRQLVTSICSPCAGKCPATAMSRPAKVL